jgi:hypothetical protein
MLPESAAAFRATMFAPRKPTLEPCPPRPAPNNPLRLFDNASADELRAETMRQIAVLPDAGLIHLEALPVPEPRIPN